MQDTTTTVAHDGPRWALKGAQPTPVSGPRVRPSRTTVALVTASRLPDGMEDAPELTFHFAQAGARADLVVWDDPHVCWESYDHLVLHSPWDYGERPKEFLWWLSRFEGDSRLINAYPLIAWNLDKMYLKELEEQGIRIPATVIEQAGAHISVEEVIRVVGSGPVVVKPAVGGGGRTTFQCPTAQEALDAAARNLTGVTVVVQKFEPAILSGGEYSAVVLGGTLSHVVLKRPAAGEFRVQSHFGGTTEVVPVREWMTDFVARVMRVLPAPAVYARVDFLASAAGSPTLMEVELAEPDLFLRYGEQAYPRFVDLVLGEPVTGDQGQAPR